MIREMVLRAVNGLFELYFILIIIRIFMSWIPSIDWEQQPIKFVRIVTDAYLDIFRRFVPAFGGIDFSPIIAIIILQILQGVITSILSSI